MSAYLILILVCSAPRPSHKNSVQVQWFNQNKGQRHSEVAQRTGQGYKQISIDLPIDRVHRRNLGLHKTFRSCFVLLCHALAHGGAFQWVWGQESDLVILKYWIVSVDSILGYSQAENLQITLRLIKVYYKNKYASILPKSTHPTIMSTRTLHANSAEPLN